MGASDHNTILINGYLRLLEVLNEEDRLALIRKLAASEFSENNKDISRMLNSFGAWKDDRDADEIIDQIQNSRKFSRQIESIE